MHAPGAARGRGLEAQWGGSGRLATLCHPRAGHTHDPIPDTNMAMAHPLARAVPQVAQGGTHTMRLAGVPMGSTPKPTKVGNPSCSLLAAGDWCVAGEPRWGGLAP